MPKDDARALRDALEQTQAELEAAHGDDVTVVWYWA